MSSYPILRPLPQCQLLAVAKSFTPAQLARCVGEAFADPSFFLLVSPSWTDTSYTVAAAPFFRVVYVLVMMKQYFNQCVNPGGGGFEA